ncbi:C6 zinc finger domain protein [Colletotrichum truncatum]|uniref:C6 zinc finger domain protein n=1 Tax=Colletotrichum truncatum TaxID=5467 RepID=A0ACC3ZIR3_COLTU|nr:C6 zinc finger domain protein [Colletotrichum truncatum]KAF6791830.1 C6 zinc finger domain protein [Colletotrichum truncatum]
MIALAINSVPLSLTTMSSPNHADSNSAASVTSSSPPSDSQQKPKRARTSKPKVKTGCNNCKQRRIKCDEKRPSCSQCVRSKKICTGYPPPSRSARPHEVLAIAPKPLAAQNGAAPVRASIDLPPRRAQKVQARRMTPPQTPDSNISVTLYRPAGNLQLTPQEGLYFQLFRSHTANELSGYFDSVFWTRTVLQECHSENAIRHAVVALGALYKTLEQSCESPPGSPSDSLNPADGAYRHWEVAVKQYSEAINALVHLNRDQKSHRTLLMASVLLACFDSFIGDHRQAIRQIQTGLGLLEKLRAERRRSFLPISEEPVEEELITMFTRLAIQAKSYDMAFHFPHPYVIRLTPQNPEFPQSPPSDAGSSPSSIISSSSVPEQFFTLMEARNAWDKLLEKMLRFTESLFIYQKSTGANGPMGILPKSLKQYGMSFKGQLDGWSEAFEYLLESRTAPGVSHQEKAGIAVLKMFQIMSQILFLMTYSDNESQFDLFQPQFKAIVDLASEVVGDEERRAAAKRCPDPALCPHRHNHSPDIFGGNAYNTYHIKPSFSADLGIVPPLFVVATKCRHPIIRRQAIQLLSSSARREGMWDSELTARIGQWVVNIEEEEDKASSPKPSQTNGGARQGSVDFGEDVPLGPGGNARWDARRGSTIPGLITSKRTVPEEKRVMVRAVDFDLRTRFANLQVGTRGIIPGSPDLRSRVTQLTW